MDPQIPDKLYFKIGEVADLIGVKPHVLRYWESEFEGLQPVKSRSRQRLYRRQDIETALQIKDLLHGRGFTIAGAQKLLRSRGKANPAFPESSTPIPIENDFLTLLASIREDLVRLKDSLGTDDDSASR